MKLNIRGKLFAVSLGLIGVSMLAGELYLRPTVEADLLERRGRVQSRSALLDDVWGMSGEVTTRTVDTHVKRLREKLGSAGPYIETVRGVGYRFKR